MLTIRHCFHMELFGHHAVCGEKVSQSIYCFRNRLEKHTQLGNG